MSRIDPTCAEAAPPPSSFSPERRRRRSEDTITALHYQLSVVRAVGKLDALVLVDDRGCLVAGAGAWPVCEELAAYAPLLADGSVIATAAVSTRIASLSTEVEVRTLALEGAEAVLASRGGGADRTACMLRAAAGCARILRTAA